MVHLWDAANGSIAATLGPHGHIALSVAWSPDGSLLASGSGDGTVRVWNLSAPSLGLPGVPTPPPAPVYATPRASGSTSPVLFWRSPPSVSLTSTRTTAPAGTDSILTLSILNPGANDWDVRVDAILKLPSGVSVEGASFAAGGSNQMISTFTTPPGKENHVTLRVRANEPGEMVVESQLLYFPVKGPEAHKEELHTLQSTHVLRFTSPETPAPPVTPTPPMATPRATPGFDGLGLLLALCVLLGLRRGLSPKRH